MNNDEDIEEARFKTMGAETDEDNGRHDKECECNIEEDDRE